MDENILRAEFIVQDSSVTQRRKINESINHASSIGAQFCTCEMENLSVTRNSETQTKRTRNDNEKPRTPTVISQGVRRCKAQGVLRANREREITVGINIRSQNFQKTRDALRSDRGTVGACKHAYNACARSHDAHARGREYVCAPVRACANEQAHLCTGTDGMSHARRAV